MQGAISQGFHILTPCASPPKRRWVLHRAGPTTYAQCKQGMYCFAKFFNRGVGRAVISEIPMSSASQSKMRLPQDASALPYHPLYTLDTAYSKAFSSDLSLPCMHQSMTLK